MRDARSTKLCASVIVQIKYKLSLILVALVCVLCSVDFVFFFKNAEKLTRLQGDSLLKHNKPS